MRKMAFRNDGSHKQAETMISFHMADADFGKSRNSSNDDDSTQRKGLPTSQAGLDTTKTYMRSTMSNNMKHILVDYNKTYDPDIGKVYHGIRAKHRNEKRMKNLSIKVEHFQTEQDSLIQQRRNPEAQTQRKSTILRFITRQQ